jgi:polyisoprenoid-binding protein YceI
MTTQAPEATKPGTRVDPGSTWILEPGHTEAEFRARHMMVTWVRGLFKDIHGRIQLDWDNPLDARFEGEIDATGLWTGQPQRDAHLRSADFFDVENHPRITFRGGFGERTGSSSFTGEVELTSEPRRIGFEATARINRHDFGVSWQDEIPGGGVVVSNEIDVSLDIEAILLEDLERTGAIDYYRDEPEGD